MSSIQYLEAHAQKGQIIRSPKSTADYSLIVLHGLGATANDFYPLLPEFSKNLKGVLRGVFPQAPTRPVTFQGGYPMPSWYDILSFEPQRKVDQAQINGSVSQIIELIEHEHHKGIPYQKIILAGFSQGGAIALETSLRVKHALGGVLAMSTYLFEPESPPQSACISSPYLIQHGKEDPVVAYSLGERSAQGLKSAGYQVQWEAYAMQHEVCPQQIQSISRWLTQVIDAPKASKTV